MMSETALTDFLATLADPEMLERFRTDPDTVLAEAGLPDELAALIREGSPGKIRVRGVQELERAGMAPLVSDLFNLDDPMIYDPKNVTTVNTTWVDVVAPIESAQYTPSELDIIDVIDEAVRYFDTPVFDQAGQLVIVGSGIRAIADLTAHTEAQIRAAQKVLYCVADPVTERRIHALNPTAESLYGLYGNDKPRIETYREMAAALLAPVRAGLRVCGVFYGHPGVFAWPTHQAVRTARRDGRRAEMYPAVSADATLFADLGIDPSQPGCHSLEATEFLIRNRVPDTSSHFLLWQAECTGDAGFNFAGYKRHNFEILIEQLCKFYPASHPIYIYEASALPQGRPKIIKTSLDTIRKEQLTGISTLYLPPAVRNELNQEMVKRLGL